MVSGRKVQAVIHRSGPEFLLLHYSPPKNYWQSLTGNLQDGEDEKEGLMREITEETGLPELGIVRFSRAGSFGFTARGRSYSETVYSVLVRGESMVDLSGNPDHEHNAYGWFDPLVAQRLVRWDITRSAIREIASTVTDPDPKES